MSLSIERSVPPLGEGSPESSSAASSPLQSRWPRTSGAWRRERPRALLAAAALGALVATACSERSASAGIDVEAERRLQTDLRRAIVNTKSLGRFGDFALFQENVSAIPCDPPLDASRRVCEVEVIGKGRVRLTLAPAELSEPGRVKNGAVIAIEYPTDCDRQRFDFKTFDNVLPRVAGGSDADGRVWEDHLTRVIWRQQASDAGSSCQVRVEASPQLLERVRAR